MKKIILILVLTAISFGQKKIDVNFGEVTADIVEVDSVIVSDSINIGNSAFMVNDSTLTLGGVCITTPGRDTTCWSESREITDFRIGNCMGFFIDNRNDPLAPGATIADSVGWIFQINTGVTYANFAAMVEFGPNRRIEGDNSDELWTLLLNDTSAVVASGLVPPVLGHKIIEIDRDSGTVNIITDLTAGTIEADNGFSGSWVNAESDTVKVIGGIIVDVVSP